MICYCWELEERCIKVNYVWFVYTVKENNPEKVKLTTIKGRFQMFYNVKYWDGITQSALMKAESLSRQQMLLASNTLSAMVCCSVFLFEPRKWLSKKSFPNAVQSLDIWIPNTKQSTYLVAVVLRMASLELHKPSAIFMLAHCVDVCRWQVFLPSIHSTPSVSTKFTLRDLSEFICVRDSLGNVIYFRPS